MKYLFSVKRNSSVNRYVVVLLVGACAALAMAAPSAKYWLFSNKKEMQKAVPYYSNNPRATYYVIMRARNKGMAGLACASYHDLLKKNGNDPYLQSAYAFSHFMAVGEFSKEYFTEKASALTQELRTQQLEAKYYRDAAIKADSNSPVILVETAVPKIYGSEAETRSEAVDYLRKAVRLAPEWADSQYWLGQALDALWAAKWSYASAKDRDSLKPLLYEQIASLKRAEKLDPTLHGNCLIGYSTAYYYTDQVGLALRYSDAYSKLHPEDAKKPSTIKTRRQMVEELEKKRAEAKARGSKSH